MSSLRVLGLSYLATASLFTLAIFFSDHAALRMVTDEALQSAASQFQARVMTPVLLFARMEDEKIFDPQASLPQVSVPLASPGPNDARTFAHVVMPPIAAKKVVAPVIVAAVAEPTIIMPDLPEAADQPASAPPPLPKFTSPTVADPAMPQLPQMDIGPAARAAVTARLMQNLTPEMLQNFDLFLYVSKSAKGPLAQRLYIFKKDDKGALVLAYDWAASTGREQYEISPRGAHTDTDTPAGFYELDPSRQYRAYHSHSWDQSMPYAMFFNWENHGNETGLAIHAATGKDIAKLGSRASAGCVHISPAHAQMLYDMIRTEYRGKAPRFAYDRDTQTMSNRGEMMHDADGNLVMADGFRVLIDIEDFSGASRIATLN